MPIVPAVLVTLDENRLAARDEETGGRVCARGSRRACGSRPRTHIGGPARSRRGETRQGGGAANQPAFEDLIEMTVRANEERDSKER